MIIWPGLRRSVSAIQRLFNSASFYAPLTHSLVPERGTGSPTFTRATTATVKDHEGVLRTAIAGEARFEGARRVRNLLTYTEDLTNAVHSVLRLSKTNSTTLTETAVLGSHVLLTNGSDSYVAGNTYVLSCRVNFTGRSGWVVFGAGNAGSTISCTRAFNPSLGTFGSFASDVGATFVGYDIGDVDDEGFSRISLAFTTTATTAGGGLQLYIDSSSNGSGTLSYTGDTGVSIQATDFQLEDITGRTDQTTPSEYVSVGVLSAPYHGSGVDGVKCFPYDLDGNPLPSEYTYDAVSLNGVAGTYVSTPDSVALDAITEHDIRVKVQFADWTPSVSQMLAASRNGIDARFALQLLTGGDLMLYWYTSGAVYVSVTSSAAVVANANDTLWIRATRSGTAVNFYQSADGETWTAVGAQQTASSASFSGSTLALYLGQTQDGSAPLSGKIYQAQIYNGINGTLAVDFDASRYAGGSTLTGSTGETWTLNGNAVIHPTNSPMLGYVAEGARTNLTIWNRDLTNAAWTRRSGTVTTALTAVGADGAANSATAVRNLGASGVDDLYQTASYAVTAGVRVEPSLSLRAVSTSGTLRFANAYDVGASGAWNIDLSLVSTTRMERITRNHPSVTITSEWVGGSLNFVQPIFDTTTGPLNFDVDLIQVELGSFASSPIATTTAAVTRDADVLTYSSAGNIDGTKGWCYAEAATQWLNSGAGGERLLSARNGGANIIPLYNVSPIGMFDGTGSVSGPAFTGAVTPTKFCSTWLASGTKAVAKSGTVGAANACATGGVEANVGVGCDPDGTDNFFGTIRNVRIGQRQLSASELGAITS